MKSILPTQILLLALIGVVIFYGNREHIVLTKNQAQVNQLETQIAILQKDLNETRNALHMTELGVKNSQASSTLSISKLTQELNAVKLAPKDITIDANEISKFLTGVVSIQCNNVRGSGTLWNFPETGPSILTNNHIVNATNIDSCSVYSVDDQGAAEGRYTIWGSTLRTFNRDTDESVAEIQSGNPQSKKISSLNYSIGDLRKCATTVSIGTPIVIMGFPAYAEKSIPSQNIAIAFRTATNGIVSGLDTSVSDGIASNLPFPNYFISAKIDSGNSGGIALSKDSKGLCVLGIPTWLTVGKFETQGLVQNIHNVFYKGKK